MKTRTFSSIADYHLDPSVIKLWFEPVLPKVRDGPVDELPDVVYADNPALHAARVLRNGDKLI